MVLSPFCSAMTPIAGAGRVSFGRFGVFAQFRCCCMPRFFLAMLNLRERCYSRDAMYADRGSRSVRSTRAAPCRWLDFHVVDYVSGARAALNALIE